MEKKFKKAEEVSKDCGNLIAGKTSNVIRKAIKEGKVKY